VSASVSEIYRDSKGRVYVFGMENAEETCEEFFQLYTLHYNEMRLKLEIEGVKIPPFKPRLEAYYQGARTGNLLHFTVRHEGQAVGYCNCWLTLDAHNSQLIAREDTVYIFPGHRNGVGAKLVMFGLAELKRRGVKRLHVHAATDPRVVKLWERQGFKPVGMAMMYVF
jgi:ribosomal protein S18 acetylase RimI-like enzyme